MSELLRCCRGCQGCPDCPTWYASHLVASPDGDGDGRGLDGPILAGLALLEHTSTEKVAKYSLQASTSAAAEGASASPGRCQTMIAGLTCGGLMVQAEVDESEPWRCLTCARPAVAARPALPGELVRAAPALPRLPRRKRGGWHKKPKAKSTSRRKVKA